MLTLTYTSSKDAEAEKVEFSDILPDYNVEYLPPSKTVGE